MQHLSRKDDRYGAVSHTTGKIYSKNNWHNQIDFVAITFGFAFRFCFELFLQALFQTNHNSGISIERAVRKVAQTASNDSFDGCLLVLLKLLLYLLLKFFLNFGLQAVQMAFIYSIKLYIDFVFVYWWCGSSFLFVHCGEFERILRFCEKVFAGSHEWYIGTIA